MDIFDLDNQKYLTEDQYKDFVWTLEQILADIQGLKAVVKGPLLVDDMTKEQMKAFADFRDPERYY